MEQLTGEVLNINNEYDSYQAYKAAVDAELQRSAEGFVRIGYLLKVARDTDILSESGYNSVNEFAEAEYSLDKSQVSRFIRINDEFSEGGYSDRLQDRYQRFGYAKLALMLMLPAAVNEELSADYTKSEIQTIKEEIDEEKDLTDLEVMLEAKDEQQQEYDLLGRVLYQLGRDNPPIYIKIHDIVHRTEYTMHEEINKVYDVLAPAGEAIISVRIAGEGKKLLSIKGVDTDPVIIDVRTAEKTACTWSGFMSNISKMCMEDSPKENWTSLYGEKFLEEKAEVAPVQPEQGRQAPKKSPRVSVSRPEKLKETGEDKSLTDVKTERQEAYNGDASENEGKQSETRAGQDRPSSGTSGAESRTIDMEAPDAIPAGSGNHADSQSYYNGKNVSESGDTSHGTGKGDGKTPAGDAADTGKDQPAAGYAGHQLNITDYPQYMPDSAAPAQHTPQYMIRGYLDALRDNLDMVYTLTDSGEYGRAEEYIEAVRGTIHKIRDVRRN